MEHLPVGSLTLWEYLEEKIKSLFLYKDTYYSAVVTAQLRSNESLEHTDYSSFSVSYSKLWLSGPSDLSITSP